MHDARADMKRALLAFDAIPSALVHRGRSVLAPTGQIAVYLPPGWPTGDVVVVADAANDFDYDNHVVNPRGME